MPYRIAERLRQRALIARLAGAGTDKNTADELERISAELARKTQKLYDLFNHIEKAS